MKEEKFNRGTLGRESRSGRDTVSCKEAKESLSYLHELTSKASRDTSTELFLLIEFIRLKVGDHGDCNYTRQTTRQRLLKESGNHNGNGDEILRSSGLMSTALKGCIRALSIGCPFLYRSLHYNNVKRQSSMYYRQRGRWRLLFRIFVWNGTLE